MPGVELPVEWRESQSSRHWQGNKVWKDSDGLITPATGSWPGCKWTRLCCAPLQPGTLRYRPPIHPTGTPVKTPSLKRPAADKQGFSKGRKKSRHIWQPTLQGDPGPIPLASSDTPTPNHSVPGTQAGQSPERLFSPSGERAQVQQSLGRRPLRVPYEPIGGVENLLARAQPVELTHHGSHPARGVEHGLTHLWGWRGKGGPQEPAGTPAGVAAPVPLPGTAAPCWHLAPTPAKPRVFCGRLRTHLPARHVLHDSRLLLQVLPKHLENPAGRQPGRWGTGPIPPGASA